MSDCFDAALGYARRGWPVVPLYHPIGDRCSCGNPECRYVGKHPIGNEWQKRATTDPGVTTKALKKKPEANISLLTGPRSHLYVLDIDPRNGGDNSLRELEQSYRELPETPMVLSGGGGVHYCFTYPGWLPSVDPARGINFLADGHQVVAPPSLHPSGKRYEWEICHYPDDVPLAEVPDWLVALIRDKVTESTPEAVELPDDLPRVDVMSLKISDRMKDVILKGKDPHNPERYPSRSEALWAIIQAMVAGGHDDATIAAVVMDPDNAISEKPLSQKNQRNPRYLDQVRAWVAKEIGRARARHQPSDNRARLTVGQPKTPPGARRELPNTPLSDVVNAEELVEQHGKDLRYCHPWSKWLVWTGTHWRIGDTGEVIRRCMATVKDIMRRATYVEDAGVFASMMSHAKISLSSSKLSAMATVAQSEPGIPVLPDDLDADPWLLNCRNGTRV